MSTSSSLQSVMISDPVSSRPPINILFAGSLPSSDPCSLNYENYTSRLLGRKVTRQDSIRSTASAHRVGCYPVGNRKAVRAMLRKINSPTKIKEVRSANNRFITPVEYANLQRKTAKQLLRLGKTSKAPRVKSSTRIALPIAQQTHEAGNRSITRSNSIQASLFASRISSGRYTIHSDDSPVREPSIRKKAVRTSHPTVSHVIERPSTAQCLISDQAGAEETSRWSFDSADFACELGDLDLEGQVQPMRIVRNSGIDVEKEPHLVAAMIDRIDGIVPKKGNGDRTSFLSTARETNMSTISLPAASHKWQESTEVFELGDEESMARMIEHRQNALAALESSIERSSPRVTFDVPSTNVSRHSIPRLPVGARKSACHKRFHSADDVPALSGSQLYMAYNGSFAPFAPFPEMVETSLTSATGTPPNTPEDKPIAIAAIKGSPQHLDLSMPSLLEEAEIISITPSPYSHYSPDDFAVVPQSAAAIERPRNPSPESLSSSLEPFNAATLDTHDQPAPTPRITNFSRRTVPMTTTDARTTTAAPSPEAKQILTRAHAKAKRMSKRPITVPARLPMNDNGFPVLPKNSGQDFQVEPKYERRSMNDVEAKFARERARKMVRRQEEAVRKLMG